MANATKYYDAPSVLCGDAPTTAVKIDSSPAKIVNDFNEAVKCLFCCCCSGSGSGGGSGSGSGSGSCCPNYGWPLNPGSVPIDVYAGYSYSEGFVVCLPAGGNFSQTIVATNRDTVLLKTRAFGFILFWSEPCGLSSEILPYYWEELDLPLGEPVSIADILYENLQPCCSYFGLMELSSYDPSAMSFMARPTYEDLVDTGVEPSTGSEGIAGPGCVCYCEKPPAVTKMSGMARPSVPLAEEGFVLDHAFLDLDGEPNCKYLWNLHVDWIGQGDGAVFARDRCSVIHIDRRSRDVAEGDGPPSTSFDYQLLTCGPATLGMQIRNSVVKGVSHPGQVTVSAELAECMWGYNKVCCCGPYPPCPDVAADPVVKCSAQADDLPKGWIVDENTGFILAGAADEAKLAGLSYLIDGDPTCAYKVRIELDITVSPTCLATFAGGDYAALAVGEDGKGSLYTDLWVCGGTSFALLLSGQGGRATFKVTYANERRAQTPICCL